jgi:hypothetical protein
MKMSWVWWSMLIIPALRRLRQEDLKFEDCLGHIGRPCLKKKKERKEGRKEKEREKERKEGRKEGRKKE